MKNYYYKEISRGVFDAQILKMDYDDDSVMLEICRSDFDKCVILPDYTSEDEDAVREFCERYNLEMEVLV